MILFRLTKGYKTRYKLKDFRVDDIIEDIDIYPEKVKNFRNYLMNLRTPRLSRELTDYLVYKSKMRNWPSPFCGKDLLKLNKSHLKRLESNLFLNINHLKN